MRISRKSAIGDNNEYRSRIAMHIYINAYCHTHKYRYTVYCTRWTINRTTRIDEMWLSNMNSENE